MTWTPAQIIFAVNFLKRAWVFLGLRKDYRQTSGKSLAARMAAEGCPCCGDPIWHSAEIKKVLYEQR